MRSANALLVVGLLFTGTGCQILPWGKKSEPTMQKIDVRWSAYSGDVIGAATTKPVTLEQGWRVNTTLLALPQDPGQVLDPLSARGRLFAQPSLGDPILANPQLTQGARIGMDADARSWFNTLQDPSAKRNVGVVKSSSVLSDGVTLAVKAVEPNLEIELRLQRQDAQHLTLLVANKGAISSGSEAGATLTSVVGRESMLIDSIPFDPSNPLILLIPLNANQEVKAIALRFDLSLASADTSYADAVEHTRALLELSNAAVLAVPVMLPVRNDAWSGYELVLRSHGKPEQRRAAMNYVAAQTGASIAQDLIVVADDATIEQFNKTVIDSMSTLNRKGVLLGWLMDYAVIKLCADRAAGGPMPSEMTSVLTIHLGEVGRNAASLADLIQGVTAREELQTKLTVENMIYLEDSAPASRVRAFDYLAARGKAPPGYDPLGTLKLRREAIERALTSATTPSATGVTP